MERFAENRKRSAQKNRYQSRPNKRGSSWLGEQITPITNIFDSDRIYDEAAIPKENTPAKTPSVTPRAPQSASTVAKTDCDVTDLTKTEQPVLKRVKTDIADHFLAMKVEEHEKRMEYMKTEHEMRMKYMKEEHEATIKTMNQTNPMLSSVSQVSHDMSFHGHFYDSLN